MNDSDLEKRKRKLLAMGPRTRPEPAGQDLPDDDGVLTKVLHRPEPNAYRALEQKDPEKSKAERADAENLESLRKRLLAMRPKDPPKIDLSVPPTLGRSR